MRALRCGEERFEPVVKTTRDGYEVRVSGEAFSFSVEEESAGVFI